MPGFDQMPREVIGHLLVVPDHRVGFDVSVAAVYKHIGNSGLVQLVKQVRVGRGKAALGGLEYNSGHVALEHFLEKAGFVVHRIVGELQLNAVAQLAQHAFKSIENVGADVSADGGKHDADLLGAAVGLPGDIAPAAPDALNVAGLGQLLHGVANRLAADAELSHELGLRRQLRFVWKHTVEDVLHDPAVNNLVL